MSKYKTSSKGKRKVGSGKKEVTGKILMNREGYAFLSIEGEKDELFIPARKLRGALHGDSVRVAVFGKRGGLRNEGEVIEIIKRTERPFIGILHVTGEQAWVITEGKNMPYDIVIPFEPSLKEHHGKKVAAIVSAWPRKSEEPVGYIVDVLGIPGNNNTEMHAILTEFGLPYKFDKKVVEAAKKISGEISPQDIKERKDFRGVTTFTIDPDDAKDYDDALSIREAKPGVWEVGVHIADVTHYVKPNSVVDREALNRATSVYLVDRTVPMLPERLSNQLCSLRPNEEKLCFSAVFEIDETSPAIINFYNNDSAKKYRFIIMGFDAEKYIPVYYDKVMP